MSPNPEQQKNDLFIKTPKGHHDFYCPMCGIKSYDRQSTPICEHVLYIEVGGHVGYIKSELQQEFDLLLESFDMEEKKELPLLNQNYIRF